MKSYTPILIVVLCIGMYFMYISPTLSEIKGLAAKKDEYNNILQKANDIKEKRDTILAEYNNIPEDEISKLNKIIPEKYESVKFAYDLNTLASQYGLSLKSMKDGSRPDSVPTADEANGILPPFRKNQVTIVLGGGYDQFLKFLDAVETNLHLMDVKSLSIRLASDPKLSTEIFEYNLEVTVYSLK